MLFHVLSNLLRDGELHPKGSTIELDESSDDAIRLVGAKVLSTDAPEQVSTPAPIVEVPAAPMPQVGGAPAESGEPSIDQDQASGPDTTQDVTPVVSED